MLFSSLEKLVLDEWFLDFGNRFVIFVTSWFNVFFGIATIGRAWRCEVGGSPEWVGVVQGER